MLDGEVTTWNDSRLVGAMFTCRDCECLESRTISRLFKSSQVPEAFKEVGFTDFIVKSRPQCVKDARDAALDYFNRFDELRHTENGGIALVGQPGSGKTRILMAVTNGLLRRGISVLYFPWVEGMDELKSDWDGLDAKLFALREVDVLFIDDLYKGRKAPTDFAKEKIYGVINFRVGNKRPLMVSSEFDFDQLFAVDEGIARRVFQAAKGHRVIMALTPEERAAGMELNYSLVG